MKRDDLKGKVGKTQWALIMEGRKMKEEVKLQRISENVIRILLLST